MLIIGITALIKNWDDVREAVLNFVNKAKEFLSGLWGTIKNIASNIQEAFSIAWEKVKEGVGVVGDVIRGVFEGVFDFIRGTINGIIRVINGLISGIVGGINTVIGGLNSINFSVPNWVPLIGGNSFGFNIPKFNAPQIPELARGGIVDRPTLALIGERGKEAVMPLENNTGWITDLANSIGSVVSAQLAINQAGFGNYSMLDSSRPIKLYLDGRKVAEGMMDDFIEIARQRDIQLSPTFA